MGFDFAPLFTFAGILLLFQFLGILTSAINLGKGPRTVTNGRFYYGASLVTNIVMFFLILYYLWGK